MSRALVTISGVIGVGVAVWLIFRLRGSEVSDSTLDPDGSTRDRMLVLASRGAGGLMGSVVAGVLVIGLGGRLMMRILAASSSERVQGAITDMDAVVGEITASGTISFVVFVGAGAGVIGWLIRLVCRRWLPSRSAVAGLAGAAIGAGLLARPSSLLEPSSVDFVLLSPAWLAVGMILGLIIVFGLLLAELSDRWADAWPTPRSPWTALWLTPLVPLVLLPPIAVGLGIGTSVRAGLGPLDRRAWWPAIDRIGRIAVPVLAVIGGAFTLLASAEILRL